MTLNLKLKTESQKPISGATIILGAKLPKNWKENWAAQKDQKYQELEESWYEETDPEIKKRKWQEAEAYWAKRRVELGFTEPEE